MSEASVPTGATATLDAPAPLQPDPGTLRRRLVPPLPSDRLASWLVIGAVTLFAGGLRLWKLSFPHQKIFDEIYYATYAEKMLRFGVVYDAAKHQAEYVVHPPVGPWMIAVGEKLWGDTSFGWRIVPAIVGTLSVLVVGRVARRLFRSTLLGAIAAFLLAIDGMAFVLSRSALLDGILSFWVLVGFAALLLDRDAARARLAERVESQGVGRWGPSLGWRPWRLAAGVALGLACGTKWSGLYVLAVFGVMSVLWDAGARRTAGVRRPFVAAVRRDALPAFGSLVAVALAVYLASWSGWFASDKGWDRQWGAQHPSQHWAWLGTPLRSLWHYHAEMWQFHSTLHTPHPYQSNPWSWLILGRPVMFFYQAPRLGHSGCPTATCSQAITAAGNPVLWWGSTVAIVVLLWAWAARRDWRAGAIIAGVVGGYLPWFFFQERTIFSFYSVVFVPFLALAVTYCLGLLLGPPTASPNRAAFGAAAVGLYVLVSTIVFFRYLPILSGRTITPGEWGNLTRLRSWI